MINGMNDGHIGEHETKPGICEHTPGGGGGGNCI